MPVYINNTNKRIYFNENNYVDPGKEVTVYDDLSSISGLTETSSTPNIIEETPLVSGGGEYNTAEEFPEIGRSDAIYIAKDENILYRWDEDSTSYIPISSLIYSGTDADPDTTDWFENAIYIQV